MELTAASLCRWRKASSANMAFTRSWQSSKLPSTATLCTLADGTVVIWRRCTSVTRPRGCNTKMSRASRSRQASMAAEPVSPEVAPTIVTRSPRRASSWSNSRPTSCRAMSLKARVGPRNSSMSQIPSSSATSGATSGWSKPAYDSAVSDSKASRSISPATNGHMTSTAVRAYEECEAGAEVARDEGGVPLCSPTHGRESSQPGPTPSSVGVPAVARAGQVLGT